jgi:hypothetical protein
MASHPHATDNNCQVDWGIVNGIVADRTLRRCPGCRKIKEGVWDVEEIVKGGRDPIQI